MVQLVDQLSKQAVAVHAVLQNEIAGISPSDPEGQEEFDTLLHYFAENRKTIEASLENQAQLVEELFEIGGRQQA